MADEHRNAFDGDCLASGHVQIPATKILQDPWGLAFAHFEGHPVGKSSSDRFFPSDLAYEQRSQSALTAACSRCTSCRFALSIICRTHLPEHAEKAEVDFRCSCDEHATARKHPGRR